MQLKSPINTLAPLNTSNLFTWKRYANDKLPYSSNLKVTGQVSADKAKKKKKYKHQYGSQLPPAFICQSQS